MGTGEPRVSWEHLLAIKIGDWFHRDRIHRRYGLYRAVRIGIVRHFCI